MITAVSFCDDMQDFCTSDGLLNQNGFIYGGSYFCDRFFLNITEDQWKCFERFAEINGTGTVLVIPMPGQSLLTEVKEKASLLLDKYHFSEIVINDYGMYRWLKELYPGMPIWFGRLLSKDIRDPRYRLEPKLFKLHDKVSNSDVMGFKPYGVEADLTEPVQQIVTDSECRIAIHTDLTYLTTGRICEFASIGCDIKEKFRPDTRCQAQCMKNSIMYSADGIRYYKYGRAVYTDSTSFPKEWETLSIRLIYDHLIRRVCK